MRSGLSSGGLSRQLVGLHTGLQWGLLGRAVQCLRTQPV